MAIALPAEAKEPVSTAFTYQGELAAAGAPAAGTFDIRFRLFDAASDGNQIGSTLCTDDLVIERGRFVVSLDFGTAFTGEKRFIEIEVRQDAGQDCSDATGYATLTSRQEMTATPNASCAQSAASLNGQSPSFYQNAANLTGTLPSSLLSGTYTGPLSLTNASNVFTGNGAAITNLSATNISSGTLDAARMPTNWAAGGDLTGVFPNPTIQPGAVTLNKLAPSVQGVLSKLSSLTPAPISLDLVTWGQNFYFNQSSIPALPPGITYTAVSAGFGHGLALRSDGTAVGWGYNLGGQINVPALPPGVTYTAVAGGGFHSLALRSDSTVVGWGSNAFGQLNVPALPPGVTYTAVAACFNSSLALRSDGMIVAWGQNNQGQIDVPSLPPGLTYTAVVSNGEADHSLGLRSDGSLAVWGRSVNGQLNVPSLPPGVRFTSVAAGATHNLGVLSDGGVVAWGGTGNNYGQISGLGAPPAGVTYTAVAAGYRHSIALRSDGVMLAWGNPAFGVTSVPALPAGVIYTAVAAGNNQTIAARSTAISPSLGSTVGLSIGSNTPPPASGGISVAGDSSFAASIAASSFSGSGAALTNLNASNIVSGTINAARLPATAARTDAANAFGNFANSFGGSVSVAGPVAIAASGPDPQMQLDVRRSYAGSALDQSNEASSTGGGGNPENWQSFTSGASGYLLQVDLRVSSPLFPSASPGTISIYAGEGVWGQLLATQSVTFAPVFNGFQSFTLNYPPPVTSGQVYTIRFTAPTMNVGWVSSTSTNPYNRGRSDFGPTYDYAFRTFVAGASSTTALGVSQGGNVGIGTSTPTQTLDVNGRINVANGVIQRGGAAITGTSDLGLYSQVAGNFMRFVTNAGEFHWSTDGGFGTNDRMVLFPNGNLSVSGSLAKAGGSFKIDHPLDPKNKILYHSFVESPDMMNVYNGNVTTDASGYATITMPDYFEALNRDFRYQLTVLDTSTFALVRVSRELSDNSFEIASNMPNIKVSWQITGIRHDAWAEKNRIPNSVDKVGSEKGKYLHPEAFNQPADKGAHITPAASQH
jgi:hypothetical protein